MHEHSFPKGKRLLKNKEFKKVYAEGRKNISTSFVLHCLKAKDEEQSRIGISVGRKIGNAVLRNRVKRKIRELMRTCPQPLVPGFWVVVTARNNECTKAKNADLKKDLYQSIYQLFNDK